MPDYANVLVKVVAIFGVINRVPPTKPARNVFFCYAVAHILTPLINLAFRPKSIFKNKCRPWAGFRLQNEVLSQLCVGMYAGGNKGNLKGYILHSLTV